MKDETPKYEFEAVAATVGRFVFKLLNGIEQARTGRVAVEIYGGPLDDGSNLARVMAEMESALVEAPAGYSFRTTIKPESIFEVWAAYTLARDAFRETVG